MFGEPYSAYIKTVYLQPHSSSLISTPAHARVSSLICVCLSCLILFWMYVSHIGLAENKQK